jgi:hypothetical protein
VLLVAGSRSAEDFAEDVADAGAAIAPAVVAVVVINHRTVEIRPHSPARSHF